MKMTDIFDLPITGREFYNHVSDDNTTAEEDIAIANCINHADALADALADLIEQSTNYAASFKSEYYAAIDALADYRGGK